MLICRQIVIYPKDVAAILGILPESGRKRLARLRAKLNKPARALVSVEEFAAATGLPEHEIRVVLARSGQAH
jgi:hypothetical protein